MNYNFYADLKDAYGIDIDKNTQKAINLFKGIFDFINHPKLKRNNQIFNKKTMIVEENNGAYIYVYSNNNSDDNKYLEFIKYNVNVNPDYFCLKNYYNNHSNKGPEEYYNNTLEGYIISYNNIIFIKFSYRAENVCLSSYEKEAIDYVSSSGLDHTDESNYQKCGISPDFRIDVPYKKIQEIFTPGMYINEYYDQLFELMNKKNKKLELKPNN